MNVETIIQRFLQVLNWIIDNPEDASLLSILALIARKVVISEISRVIQMGRDEELIWTRKRVEELTGDRWNGPQPILKRVRTQYFVNYYSYLLLGTSRVYLYRGRTKMNKAWLVSFIVYVLGQAAKEWGITFPDETANWLANGVLIALPLLFGYLNRLKKTEVPNEPLIPTESNK